MPNSYLDWTQVWARIENKQKSNPVWNNSNAFQILCLEIILNVNEVDAIDAITDGSDDRGVDAIFIDSSSSVPEIHFFQFKCVQDFKKSNSNFPSTEIDKLCNFFADLARSKDDTLNTCNPLLKEKVNDIYGLIKDGEVSFFVHLCSNASCLTLDHKERLQKSLEKYKNFRVLEHDLTDLSERLLNNQVQPVNASFVIKDYPIDRVDGDIRGVVGTVRALDLINMISDPKNKRYINPNIFHENIRSFLGVSNDINEKIYKSATSNQNYRFWYLNNGITMICDSLSYQKGFSNPVITLKNVQIVNGQQTSHILFEAHHVNEYNIRDVEILIRVYEIKTNEIAFQIAEATNSQSRIMSRDLRSNDIIQRKIEDALAVKGLFYERKRNQHILKDANKRVDALRFGQMCLAYFLEEPSRAKSQSDEIFDSRYNEIFHKNIPIEEAVAVWKLLNEVEAFKEKIQDQMRTVGGRDNIYSFVGYASFHILYACKIISNNNSRKIYEMSPAEINELMMRGTQVVLACLSKAKGASFYEYFRSIRSKNDIFIALFSPQLKLI